MKNISLLLFIAIITFQTVKSQSTEKYLIKNLVSNNEHANLGVSFYDNDFVIYSSQFNNNVIAKHSRKSRRKKVEKKTILENLDYYFGTLSEDGNIVNSQKLNNVINSDFNEKGLCFSKDQEYVFFSRESHKQNSNDKHFELFRASVVSPGSWIGIKKLPFNNDKFSIMYPTLSNDGKTLYFSSNKSGHFDIYRVKIFSEWGFTNPEKLSSNINASNSDQISPFIFNDVLYFASNQKGGLGGFDIYSINLKDKNAKATHLETPINSNTDDYCFVKKNASEGYFTSKRIGGKGKEDVYYFKELIKDNVEVVSSNEKTIVKNESAYIYQRRDSYDTITKTKKIIKYTDKNHIREGDNYSKCQMEFDKINNIYFDYSESYIREDAAIELDRVIRVLRICPDIKLIASSHTDSRASNSYNLKLSQERADSVMNYIINNGGFSRDRIISKGFGEERLANRCSNGVKCSEKEHQVNRRTHFEIENY